MKKVLWFVSHHGFGHAARSAAVMDVMLRGNSEIALTIVSAVPEQFFRDSLADLPFRLISEPCDVGLIQKNPFTADLNATLDVLARFYPVQDAWIQNLLEQCGKPDIVICDISPAGLAFASRLEIPSVLLENFTWNWLYESYQTQKPAFKPISNYLKKHVDSASRHLQAVPFCEPLPGATSISPIARQSRILPEKTRIDLGITPDQKMILITLGGIDFHLDTTAINRFTEEFVFVVTGGNEMNLTHPSVKRLPHHSRFYHPDLMVASDAIIGKLGYSTLAEAAVCGKPFLFIPRAHFRESEVLASWASANMNALSLKPDLSDMSHWSVLLHDILAKPSPFHTNGSFEAVHCITSVTS